MIFSVAINAASIKAIIAKIQYATSNFPPNLPKIIASNINAIERTTPTMVFTTLYATGKSFLPKAEVTIEGGKLPFPPIPIPKRNIPIYKVTIVGIVKINIPSP